MTSIIHRDFNGPSKLIFLSADIDGDPEYLDRINRYVRSLWKTLKTFRAKEHSDKLRGEESYIDHLKLIVHGLCISVSDRRCQGLHLYLRAEEFGSKGSQSQLSYDRTTNLIDMLTTLLDPDALEPYCSIYVGNKLAGQTSILYGQQWLKDSLVRAGLIFYNCPFKRVSEKSKQHGYLRLNEKSDDKPVWAADKEDEVGKISRRLKRSPTELELYIPKLTSLLRNSELKLELPNYWAYRTTLYRGKSPGSWRSRINPEADMFYRVFNDIDGQGGRIFGHYYQNLKSDLRQFLTIGGEKTVEIDYQSMQPCLAYSVLGLPRPADDLYAVDAPNGSKAIFKKVFLIGIGSEANGQPAKALRIKERKDRSKKPIISYAEAQALDAAFWEFHSPIAEFRCSGAWRRLQFMESEIALRVIATLVDQRIAVLPIHDGFRVAKRHEAALMTAMTEAVRHLSCPPKPILKS